MGQVALADRRFALVEGGQGLHDEAQLARGGVLAVWTELAKILASGRRAASNGERPCALQDVRTFCGDLKHTICHQDRAADGRVRGVDPSLHARRDAAPRQVGLGGGELARHLVDVALLRSCRGGAWVGGKVGWGCKRAQRGVPGASRADERCQPTELALMMVRMSAME